MSYYIKSLLKLKMSSIEIKAQKAYSSGDVIIRSKPLVHVICAEFKSKLCDFCLSDEKGLKKCSKCKQFYYCDKNCQKNDWFWHQFECHLYENYGKELNSETEFDKIQFKSKPIERLLLRLFLLITNNQTIGSKVYRLANNKFKSFKDIDSSRIEDFFVNIENPEIDDLFDYISDRFESFGLRFDYQILLELFYKVLRFGIKSEPTIDQCLGRTIAHRKQLITEKIYNELDLMTIIEFLYSGLSFKSLKVKELEEIDCSLSKSFGIYIAVTVFGHSCAPNACQVLVGNQIEVRAIKPIAFGEEITISLIDLEKSKTVRQKELKSCFDIDCNCFKCDTNSDENINYKRLHELFCETFTRINFEELDLIQEKLIKITKEIYGSYYPNLSIQFFNYFEWKLKTRFETKENLNKLANEVMRNIEITHGLDHPYYKKFLKLIESQDFLIY